MTKFLVFLLITFSSSILFGQQIIEEANRLIDEKKYDSAFKLLEKEDTPLVVG